MEPMTGTHVALEDKFTARDGRIFLTGIQALVRLSLVQQLRDRAAGLETAGFVSGYRGSPLGGLDFQLARARSHLEPLGIHFEPGVNEELALTAVWGSQMVGSFRGARHAGVHALWYGKAPGLDRATDALKHGNAAGSARHGGVLVVAGDDHECKSSTLPSQSEYLFLDAGVPILNPASVQEVLDYGLLGWALSRYAGCFTGMIALADTMDSSATVDAAIDRVRIASPPMGCDPSPFRSFRPGTPPLEQEVLLRGARLEAALAFARANRIDRVIADAPDARIGIVTTGKATLDVRQALEDLRLDPSQHGIRVYKVGMPWPLEPIGLREFAQGLHEILVVEEKRGLVEGQIRELLYDSPGPRPRVFGKRDERGAPLLPETGALSPGLVARAIADRLPDGHRGSEVRARLEELRRAEIALDAASAMKTRQPFFCSGCPHNVSTKLPEGSRGLAGIGCHYMVQWMDRRTDTYSQMGGEGVQWIGQAPFTDESHVFANLGDGTYHHSGILAIRAAVSAGVNITYKILFNDAVAMTGGQSIDGPLSVPQLTRQLAAEGVGRIVVVTDEPEKYAASADFAPGVGIHHRKSLDALQRELRESTGTSVLVYDQTCAAELRRRRKRGSAPDRPEHLFINPAVCEGCGDCSRQSNCLSIEPLDTEFGRKRRIDQTSCNKDQSCLDGLCPAFVAVSGGSLRRGGAGRLEETALAALPVPLRAPLEDPWNLVITGVGGTGVVTLAALLGMAAHLEGRASTVLDMTGLAQKGGAVISHVRLAERAESIHTTRVPTGKADALLACDLVVAASRDAAVKLDPKTTRSVVDTHLAPTAEFVMNNDVALEAGSFLTLVHDLSLATDTIDATDLSKRLLGDSVGSNIFLLGFAWQRGLVPLAASSIESAIGLNGVAVDANVQAFRWGRLAAHDPEAVARFTRPASPCPRFARGLSEVTERREEELTRYQNKRLARRYRALVHEVRLAEAAVTPRESALAEAVARGYFKLLAAKDEYEVARLHTDGAFIASLREQLEGDFTVEPVLAPPLWARTDPETGRPRKHRYGAWMMTAMKALARFKALRGTPFDPFGYTAERRLERQLVRDYEATVRRLLDSLSTENHRLAVEIAGLPERIRGYGAVKEAAAAESRLAERALLDRFFKHEHLPLPDDVCEPAEPEENA